jgi:membrane dipeptidase
MPPETFIGIGHHLSARGRNDADVAAIMGANFRRVAEQSWLTGHSEVL